MAVFNRLQDVIALGVVENCHFCPLPPPLYFDSRPLAEKSPAISIWDIHRWEVHLVGYNSVADSTTIYESFMHSCNRFCLHKICEITRNSPEIRTYSSSRSTTVSPCRLLSLRVNRRWGNCPFIDNKVEDRQQSICERFPRLCKTRWHRTLSVRS